jgi:hypothetical protein
MRYPPNALKKLLQVLYAVEAEILLRIRHPPHTPEKF